MTEWSQSKSSKRAVPNVTPARVWPKHLVGRCLTDPATGLPAPHVNMWSAENTSDGAWIGVSPLVDGLLSLFPPDRPGQGHVLFDVAHMARQRYSMLRRVCQVCRRPASLLPLSVEMSVRQITLEGTEAIAVHEPWLCDLCARYACETCPGLIRRRRVPDLVFARVDHVRYPLPMSISQGTYDPEPITRLAPVAMWAKALIPADLDRLTILTAADILKGPK